MDNKDIENKLRSSADKITVKSFSERRNNIIDGITSSEEREAAAEIPVLATNKNNAVRSFEKKKKYIFITVLALFLCIIVILATVLPIVLRKDEPAYFGPSDLKQVFPDGKEQFFGTIENAGYDIIDVTQYEIEQCVLLYEIIEDETIEGALKGGKFTVSDFERGFICEIEFYDISVKLSEGFIDGSETYTVGSTVIKYGTQFDGDLYTTNALTQYKNIQYKLIYMSLIDDCTEIFEEFFS